MTVSPIATIVVIGLLLIAGVIVLSSAAGSLMRGEPLDPTVIGIGGTCIGFVGGMLTKTTIDPGAGGVNAEPTEVTVVGQPLLTEEVHS